jgi:hypothetical protein
VSLKPHVRASFDMCNLEDAVANVEAAPSRAVPCIPSGPVCGLKGSDLLAILPPRFGL